MSSFLSAAENVAGQRQKVQRDLKKMKKAERLSWRWRIIICEFWLVLYRKNVSITVRQLYSYFWYHCDAVAIWSLMMR